MSVDNGHVHDHGRVSGAAFQLSPADRCRAARYVASTAQGADDCALLLGALGLAPEDGKRKAGRA